MRGLNQLIPAERKPIPAWKAVVTATDFPEVGDTIADLGEGAVHLQDLQDNVLAGVKALVVPNM